MSQKQKGNFKRNNSPHPHFRKSVSTFFLLFITGNGLFDMSIPKQTYAQERIETTQSLSPKTFVAKAVSRSGPAVVTIETQRRVYTNRSRIGPPGLLIDPYFERFFNFPGPQIPRSRIESGMGSGVIFNTEGLVLTNAHVVEKTERLTVGLSDGRRVQGKVIGYDSLTDLAVIKLQGRGPWPSATLGDSDRIMVGDWAIAVGNPFGLENTVTLGIISNLNRNVTQLGIADKRINLIQTDAAINPGNSGGPLLNAEGEVIGINTLVRSGPGAGLGFAIPINKAKSIAKQLINTGRATHPMIGVSLSPMPLVDRQGKNVYKSGAIVKYLISGAPGEEGGLQVNDIILQVGGELIKSPSDVVNIINKNGVNKKLRFTIQRGRDQLTIFITPIDMNDLELR